MVKERWRLVRCRELLPELAPAVRNGDQLVLDLAAWNAVHGKLKKLLSSALKPRELALR